MKNSVASKKVHEVEVGEASGLLHIGEEILMLVLLFAQSCKNAITLGCGEHKLCVRQTTFNCFDRLRRTKLDLMAFMFHLLLIFLFGSELQDWEAEVKEGFEKSKLSKQCDHR